MAFPMSREYEKGTFKHKMAEAANLPKDLALGLPVVHVTGLSLIHILKFIIETDAIE